MGIVSADAAADVVAAGVVAEAVAEAGEKPKLGRPSMSALALPFAIFVEVAGFGAAEFSVASLFAGSPASAAGALVCVVGVALSAVVCVGACSVCCADAEVAAGALGVSPPAAAAASAVFSFLAVDGAGLAPVVSVAVGVAEVLSWPPAGEPNRTRALAESPTAAPAIDAVFGCGRAVLSVVLSAVLAANATATGCGGFTGCAATVGAGAALWSVVSPPVSVSGLLVLAAALFGATSAAICCMAGFCWAPASATGGAVVLPAATAAPGALGGWTLLSLAAFAFVEGPLFEETLFEETFVEDTLVEATFGIGRRALTAFLAFAVLVPVPAFAPVAVLMLMPAFDCDLALRPVGTFAGFPVSAASGAAALAAWELGSEFPLLRSLVGAVLLCDAVLLCTVVFCAVAPVDAGAGELCCGALAGCVGATGGLAVVSSRAAKGWLSVCCAGIGACCHCEDPIATVALISDTILGTVEPPPSR